MKNKLFNENLCADFRDGDGVDPRLEKNTELKKHLNTLSSARLCRQVQKLARLALSELGVIDWDVTNVEESSKGTSLLLEVEPLTENSVESALQAVAKMKRLQPQIRQIIAEGISRKTVPAIRFVLSCGGLMNTKATFRHWLSEPISEELSRQIEKLKHAKGVAHIRLMPDGHLANEVCVGSVIATSNVIYPSAVGGDIGCGMMSVPLGVGAN